VLKSGGRWVDAPPEYGPRKTLYNRFVRWAEKGVWVELFDALAQAGGPPAQVLIDSSAVKAHRSAAGGKGEANQAIGRSRGGHTTKIHALTDANAVPSHSCSRVGKSPTAQQAPSCLRSFLITTFCTATRATIRTPFGSKLRIKARWRTSRRKPIANGRTASRRSSTATETPSNACFCRLKDFRRVATRYDRNAVNFLAAVCIAAVISYWLSVRALVLWSQPARE